jgi:hypothetical protein
VGEGEASALIPAMTADLNPAGLGFRATQRIEPETKVRIDLRLGSQMIPIDGVVRYAKAERSHLGDVYMHGLEFVDLPVADRDSIEVYCTRHSMPMWRMRYRQSIDIITRANEVMNNSRDERRRLVGLPASVAITAAENAEPASLPGMLILEELSEHGARLIGPDPIAPGTGVTFTVPGATLSGRGTVRHVQSLRTSVAVLFSMGIELESAPRPGRSLLPRFVTRALATDSAGARVPVLSAGRSNSSVHAA